MHIISEPNSSLSLPLLNSCTHLKPDIFNKLAVKIKALNHTSGWRTKKEILSFSFWTFHTGVSHCKDKSFQNEGEKKANVEHIVDLVNSYMVQIEAHLDGSANWSFIIILQVWVVWIREICSYWETHKCNVLYDRTSPVLKKQILLENAFQNQWESIFQVRKRL